MFKSINIVGKIFKRQICTPLPGTSINQARQFYENLVPSYTIYNVECPDQIFCKFTEDGNYLISLGRNQREVIVYRPTWMSFSCNGQDCDVHDLPLEAKRFGSFFTKLYSTPLASNNELISKDFFLYMERNQFCLFATSTGQQLHDVPAARGAVQEVPSIEKITIYLMRLEDGFILDKKVFLYDFINLSHNMGVYLYEDLFSVMSVRYQTIHIYQIRDVGDIVHVRSIGEFCREDDELFMNSSVQSSTYQFPAYRTGYEVSNISVRPVAVDSFLNGIKQRLLSFIFQGLWNEETDDMLRAQQLAKLYFHFEDYANLIIWRVQFLDRNHLLVKLGTIEGVLQFQVSQNAENHAAFFAVYNMEASKFVAIFQNAADDLYFLYEKYADHFHVYSNNSLHVNYMTNHSNNVHALEQLMFMKDKSGNYSQFTKKKVLMLPFMCQSLCPSPYLDQSLFKFDEKEIFPVDHLYSADDPVMFVSRRQPKFAKFRITFGLEDQNNLDSQNKGVSSFVFHPILPLIISVQQCAPFQRPVMNIHFRN